MNKKIQLLSCLRENSREKLTSVSKKTGIPISTLFDMLKELRNSIIVKHTTLVQFSKLGYHTKANVFLKIDKAEKEKAKRFLFYSNNVNSVYKINNGWDFIIETVHRNNRNLDKFLECLENKFNVERKEIHYLIDEIKKEGFCFE